MIGEIGGQSEIEAAEFLQARELRPGKPEQAGGGVRSPVLTAPPGAGGWGMRGR